MAAFGGAQLLAAIYGEPFERFEELVAPMAIAALALASSVGYGVLLKAAQRGPAILIGGALGSGAVLSFMSLLGALQGIRAGAWGLAIGLWIGAFYFIVVGSRVERGDDNLSSAPKR
jgi:hypothetical protein